MSSSITLFSNGIGHFSRVYAITAEKKVSIPFKKEHIGDVAASLQVFGKVKLSSPPSFTPSNSDSTHLKIDQSNAMRSLLQALSGAEVSVALTSKPEKKTYTLLGIEEDQKVCGNNVANSDVLVVMEGGSVRRIAFSDLVSVDFTEEAVRQEIGKALKKNFQQIKPDSTFLDLTLSPREGGDAKIEATVQYTIPVAAWKMRYAIREDKGVFNLEGAAIIDNNTDEDWIDSIISVVTGNPISFNTDIATVVVPKRRTINLVESQVLGNVNVEDGYESMTLESAVASKGARTMAMRSAAGAKMSVSNYADFGMEEGSPMAAMAAVDVAESAGVDTKEVGDFSIFTSKQPVTILARKSAVVPMFQIGLKTAGAVLYYKESNHSRRPYRAIKFKNEADYTLNRGKTTIYNDGVFSGECVLETTKPNENRTLPHCLENGVKIVKEVKGSTSTVSSIRISEGVIFQETVSIARTDYLVVNKKDEEFKIHLEHSNMLHGPNNNVAFEGVEVKETEKLHDTNGRRVYFTLQPNSKVTLTVIETMSQTNQWTIGGRFQWVQSNVLGQGLSISKDKSIQACVEIQKQIDKITQDMTDASERVDDLTEQADRVRSNLGAAKDVSGSDLVAEWVRDLDTTEKEIRNINKVQIPAFQTKQRELQQQMSEKLLAVTVAWKNEESPKAPS